MIGCAALLAGASGPIMELVIPLKMKSMTALFLILLGFAMSGISFLEKITKVFSPNTVIKIMIVLVIDHIFWGDIQWHLMRWDILLDWNSQLLINISLAVFSGFVLSLLGVFTGAITKKIEDFNKKYLQYAQMLSMVLLGIKVFGWLTISSQLIILPLIIGLGAGLLPVMLNSMAVALPLQLHNK